MTEIGKAQRSLGASDWWSVLTGGGLSVNGSVEEPLSNYNDQSTFAGLLKPFHSVSMPASKEGGVMVSS